MKFLTPFILSIFLFSCTSNASIQVEENNSSSFSFQTIASDSMGNTVRSFTGLDSTVNLFDKEALQSSFTQAGILLTSILSASTNDVTVSGLTYNINNLIPNGQQPITIKEISSEKELKLTLDEQTMASLISLMGEETLLYIEALQAPIFTGEEMSTDEYLDFMGALYGDSIQKEMKNSLVTIKLSAPNTITNAYIEPKTTGTVQHSKNTATFNLSLAELLANTSEIVFSIHW